MPDQAFSTLTTLWVLGRYENKVVFHTAGHDDPVRRIQPAEVAGMHGEVNALGIQSLRNLRG